MSKRESSKAPDSSEKTLDEGDSRKKHVRLDSASTLKEAVAKVAGDQKTTIVQQAIAKVAGQRKTTQAIESSLKQQPPKKLEKPASSNLSQAQTGGIPSENYQKSSEPSSKAAKEVKDSIDAVVGREAPAQPGRLSIEEAAAPANPAPPPNLEAAATDIGAMYARQGQGGGGGGGAGGGGRPDDPASFYRNAAGGGAMGNPGDDPRKNPGGQFDESGNPLNAYANKEVYHNRTDAGTGQRLARHGDEEHSLSGRIQKMYHEH